VAALSARHAEDDPPARSRWEWTVSGVLLAAPAGLYFWFVDAYGVNVPYEDTWNGTLPLLRAFTDGRLQLAALWAPHNENRMLVANFIGLLIDSATRMNERADMLVSGSLLLLALVAILAMATRTLRLRPLWLVPVAFLVMGLVQWENILWAFQLAWMLVLFLCVSGLAAIEWWRGKWPGLAVPMALALLASYSSLQGLLIWPVGLYYGWAVGWSRARAAVWSAVAVGATAVYWWHFGPVGTPWRPLLLLKEPSIAARFVGFLLGDVFDFHQLLLGGVTLVTALLVGSVAVFDGELRRALRLPLALVGMALGFDVLVTIGRLPLGLAAAGASRYTPYNLWLLSGLWLAAVVLLRDHREVANLARRALIHPAQALGVVGVGLIISCQVAGDIPAGLAAGSAARAHREAGVRLLLHLGHATNRALAADLFTPSGKYVRVWAEALKKHQWSLFAGPKRA
jgi:hypothetical protein